MIVLYTKSSQLIEALNNIFQNKQNIKAYECNEGEYRYILSDAKMGVTECDNILNKYSGQYTYQTYIDM